MFGRNLNMSNSTWKMHWTCMSHCSITLRRQTKDILFANMRELQSINARRDWIVGSYQVVVFIYSSFFTQEQTCDVVWSYKLCVWQVWHSDETSFVSDGIYWRQSGCDLRIFDMAKKITYKSPHTWVHWHISVRSMEELIQQSVRRIVLFSSPLENCHQCWQSMTI